jgi:hypothetical protein
MSLSDNPVDVAFHQLLYGSMYVASFLALIGMAIIAVSGIVRPNETWSLLRAELTRVALGNFVREYFAPLRRPRFVLSVLLVSFVLAILSLL